MVRIGPQLVQKKLTGGAECICPYCNAMALRCTWRSLYRSPSPKPSIRCGECKKPVPIELVADVIETIPGGDF
jgi:hypothetical protein